VPRVSIIPNHLPSARPALVACGCSSFLATLLIVLSEYIVIVEHPFHQSHHVIDHSIISIHRHFGGVVNALPC
jgi:hypothetical protein